jgi:hypothetical protein
VRSAGGDAAGEAWVHVVPSHVHVSAAPGAPPSPKSTTRAAALSYAIPCPARADGDDAGNAWLQVVPFHVHVSASVLLPAAMPPKRTTSPRAPS